MIPLSNHLPDHLLDREDGYVDLRSYAAIGNGRTVALVAHDGSVDWLPVPDLDSAPVFARLLDAGRGGYVELHPDLEALTAAGVDVTTNLRTHREYVAGTNVLCTTYTTALGVVRVTDSLNLGSTGALPWSELARCVDGISGAVPMTWSVVPGTMLNTASPWVQHTDQGPVIRVGEVSLGVLSNHAGQHDVGPQAIRGRFTTGEGTEHLVAVVGTAAEPLRLPEPAAIHRNVGLSVDLWRRWADLLEYNGRYVDDVHRSALVLKMLGHNPSGSIAAAATTSLPENREGTKNYDYRFAWIRDAAYTLHALLRLGEQEDVHAAVSWLLRLARAQTPDLHVLNRLNGSVPQAGTTELDVPGWRGIGPVVTGNDAADQLQLGVYGDIFDMATLYVEGGNVLDADTARMLSGLADAVCDRWIRPDAGMWELEKHRHYTSSKMGCWVALDRAVTLADRGHLPGTEDRWRAERDRIRAWIEEYGWSEERGAYVWYPGTDQLDASVLLHTISGFDTGPRMSSTIDVLRTELGRGPLLYRYSGMPDEEGTFTACGFWCVASLALVGRREEAENLMGQLLDLSNDVGLYTEMIDPEDRSFLGNMPQALSHLALLVAALTLNGQ
ncbi:glycoside hydrolase family 15 protein [Citricoccus sp. GCM10030269]|uniref:glycoside hydrolase family 15 protein n=1 Tax=Citricoccus sp. GCM10030269 TaxID=3273388 RepID=UPI00360DB450